MPIVRNYSRYKTNTILYPSLSAFYRDQLHDGIQVLPFGDSVLEILVEDRNADTTIILFHAAVDPNQTTLPIFIGHQLTAQIEANLIFVSEPSLQFGASIGWYTGDPKGNLQKELVKILGHIQAGLSAAKHLVFYGSSAGGFASLFFSHQFPNSLAIVANPQTDIAKYHQDHVERYLELVWGTSRIDEVAATTEVCTPYKKSFPNYVGYLQNLNDELHIIEHCRPWADATRSFSERRKFIIDDWGEGHAPPNFFLLQGILKYAVSLHGDWATFLRDDSFVSEPTLE